MRERGVGRARSKLAAREYRCALLQERRDRAEVIGAADQRHQFLRLRHEAFLRRQIGSAVDESLARLDRQRRAGCDPFRET